MALPSAALRNDSWPLHGLAKRSQGPDARKGRLLTNLIQVPAALKGHSDSHSSGLLRVSIKELLVGNLRPKERSKGSLSGSARPSLPALCGPVRAGKTCRDPPDSSKARFLLCGYKFTERPEHPCQLPAEAR